MLDYYCYVYYTDKGEAYYVGKGQKLRAHYRQDSIPVASKELTQFLYFKTEWESFECEIELINFWKRKVDGGPLMNVCLGGPGKPGIPMSESNKQALLSNRPQVTMRQIQQLVERSSKEVILEDMSTGEVISFSSGANASRTTGMAQSSVSALRKGIFKTCKGWRFIK